MIHYVVLNHWNWQSKLKKGQPFLNLHKLCVQFQHFTKSIFTFFFSFTLYPAHSRVGRGNLVLRHSVPHFLPNCVLEALRVEWQNSTPRLTSTPERRNGNINLNKYFISSSGDRTHIQSVLQSHFVPLRHDRPQFTFLSLIFCQLKLKAQTPFFYARIYLLNLINLLFSHAYFFHLHSGLNTRNYIKYAKKYY